MKTIVISGLMVTLLILNVNAQDINKSFFEEKVGYNILIDKCDRSGLEGALGHSFKKQYADYTIDEKTTAKLSKHMDGIKIKIVLGTWCHDSKMQLPRFMKILDQINFEENQMEIISVDRSKKTHAFSIDELDIKLVPTFIFYKEGKEIGRIIESPEKSLEKDILNILN